MTITNAGASAPATMSSLEIAKLTSKQHDDVLRDIRNIFAQAEIDLRRFAEIEIFANNRKRTIYRLPRAECDLVISGYSVKYRWAIIQRWHELEAEAAKLAAPKAPPALTYSMMDHAVQGYTMQHGRDAALSLLASFGAARLPDVAEAQWPALHAALQCPPPAVPADHVARLLQQGRWLMSFTDTGGVNLNPVPTGAFVIAETAFADVLREPGAVALDLLPGIIDACVQRLANVRSGRTAVPPDPRLAARGWKDPAQAEALLKSMRFKLEEMYDLSLITPERVEALCKANVIGPRQALKLRRMMA